MVIAGDGPPGSSAKYCTYSFIDTDMDCIIYSVTVDKKTGSTEVPKHGVQNVYTGIELHYSKWH